MWGWLACAQPDPAPVKRPDPKDEVSGTSLGYSPPPPRPEPVDTNLEVLPVDPAEVCYLGPDRSSDVCLPVAGLDVTPPDYEYPEPLYGSAQYQAPRRYLWLDELDGGIALAPNFLLLEIAVPEKGPFAVVQPHAVASLQAVRDDLGALIVNSGYRNPAYNAGVGGATWSRHQYGDALTSTRWVLRWTIWRMRVPRTVPGTSAFTKRTSTVTGATTR